MSDNYKDKDYHYYSYGRFSSDKEKESARSDAAPETMRADEVEGTPPRELKTYPMMQTSPRPAAWSYSAGPDVKEPRRSSSFRSVVASFLAGAVVVGSLMFASDKLNLFSGSDAL